MHRRHVLFAVAQFSVAVAACGGSAGGAPPVTPPGPLAGETAPSLADLDRALLDARAWQADVRIRASGRGMTRMGTLHDVAQLIAATAAP